MQQSRKTRESYKVELQAAIVAEWVMTYWLILAVQMDDFRKQNKCLQ